jgi:hypothetical protein
LKESELLKELEELDKKILKIQNNELEEEELVSEYNYNNFIEQINYLDKENKELGFEK